MSNSADIGLVDKLRAVKTETEWLEFKRNQIDYQQLGEYISALSNEAALQNQPHAYLVFGVDDATHEVVGTTFDPYTEKGKGNQSLLIWLRTKLNPKIHFDTKQITHPRGLVVIFVIDPASDGPTTFAGTGYCRSGASKTELTINREKERRLWSLNTDWSATICKAATFDDLDPKAVSQARKLFADKHSIDRETLNSWDTKTFLNKARLLKQGEITNTALLLLGRPESASLLSPSVARISWFARDQLNNDIEHIHLDPPFLNVGDRLLQKIRNPTIQAMPSGTLFPKEIYQYDPWVLREALHNAIAHQDYRSNMRITVVDSPVQLLITNAGSFLPGSIETVIQQDSPQLAYRNTFLTHAMVELNMIETRGGGIKLMFEKQRRRFFPLPDYNLSKSTEVSVTISGRIHDERYTQLLMERTDLPLLYVMLLDRVQKKQPISKEEHQQLKAASLIEGRYPNAFVSGAIAKATGESGRHIRNRGFDNRYYKDLLIELLRTHGPVGREEIDQLLLHKLPESLAPTQKGRKVSNLIQELRRDGIIINLGSRTKPIWKAV